MINLSRVGGKSFSRYRLKVMFHLYYWSLVLILGLSGCTPPGGNQKIHQVKITIRNTLPVQRKNVPIVITLDELRKIADDFSLNAYLVVSGQPPTEIHSQADDTNYDGQKDGLVFLVDLEPQETKVVTVRYSPKNKNPMSVTIGFTRRTRAGIFPELNGLAALESELGAYVLKHNGAVQAYGKRGELLFDSELHPNSLFDNPGPISPDLLRAFETNNIQLSRQTTIEIQKPDRSWLITDLAQKQRYVLRNTSGKMNIYKAKELSINRMVHQTVIEPDADAVLMTPLAQTDGLIGCGGFALWDKTNQQLIDPSRNTSYVRVLADGPIRSIVQLIIPDWSLKGDSTQLRSTFYIYAGNRWVEHRISVRGLSSEYRIATGIPNLGPKPGMNRTEGWLSTWREETSASAGIGMGIIYPVDGFDAFENLALSDSETNISAVIMRPNAQGEVTYRFFSVWGVEDNDVQTQADFDQYVEAVSTDSHTPPVIQFESQTPKKE